MAEKFLNDDEYMKQMLYIAQQYADTHSTCAKVKVGSVIFVPNMAVYLYGCNHGVHNCVRNGCRRVALYGEASKNHRLPSDCDAIHSEVDAICNAASEGVKLQGATIYVSRYPCENCARAIAESGIKRVVYGRKESASYYTEMILADKGVELVHIQDWDWEDNNE